MFSRPTPATSIFRQSFVHARPKSVIKSRPDHGRAYGDYHHHHEDMYHYRRRFSLLSSPAVVVLGFIPILTFGLGTWQIQRLKWKTALIEDLGDKLQRDPMTLPRNVNLGAIPDFEFRKVRVQGEFDTARSILLGPRTREGVLGYHIVTPLKRTSGGSTVLVDRGFVSRDHIPADRSLLDKVFGSAGLVDVVGLLRKSQERNSFTPENNVENREWYWVDVRGMAEFAGGEGAGVQPVFIEAVFDGNTAEAAELISKGIPVGRPTNIELRNMHTTYAVTWYSLSVATAVMFWHLVQNKRRRATMAATSPVRGSPIEKS